jgi:hypothetical protein
MNTFVVNALENHIAVPGVQHADETVDDTVRQLAADLNELTCMVLMTPNVTLRVTFDGTDPVAEGHGHLVTPGETLPLNLQSAVQLKWVKEYSTDSDSIITVTELTR